MAGKQNNMKRFREHDYLYDQNFILCHPKDFAKQAYSSAVASTKYILCPVFEDMFSELPKYYRRIERVGYPNVGLPEHIEISYNDKTSAYHNENTKITGKNMPLYFSSSNAGNLTVIRLDNAPRQHLSNSNNSRPHCKIVRDGLGSKDVQTKYRESSAQTDAYLPNHKQMRKGVPEIYLCANIHSSNEGGVVHVKRLRCRRAWLEYSQDPRVIHQLEMSDNKYREHEIEKVLLCQEETLGDVIPTTVNEEVLNKQWLRGRKRLLKKITNINIKKQKVFSEIEKKQNNLKLATNGKSVKLPTTLVRKPNKIGIDLNCLPFESDTHKLLVSMDFKIENKYGLCDKFEKKKERVFHQIKDILQDVMNPHLDVSSHDTFSYREDTEMEASPRETTDTEALLRVETSDKNVGIDFLSSMSKQNDESSSEESSSDYTWVM